VYSKSKSDFSSEEELQENVQPSTSSAEEIPRTRLQSATKPKYKWTKAPFQPPDATF
jgi:hypothetical protein